jgi:23S rRNA (adenine2503-C2)-methyltransferase
VGTQLFQWIWKGEAAFQGMTNLSREVRNRLSETALLRTGKVTARLRDEEGTEKVQLLFPRDTTVEAVLLSQYRGDEDSDSPPPRHTACVSSQSGCAMACAFCKTGTLGLRRNLAASEILEQFLVLEGVAGAPLDNVVCMGMGEPLANLAALRSALAILCHPKGRALSPRRLTVSTAGLIGGIRDLADAGPPVRLAVSLTTADPELRAALMPVAKTNPLPELKEAIRYYTEKSGRRPTLEAVLIHDTNTSPALARTFAAFARDVGAHVNLIPWNPVPGIPFTEPTAKECRSFQTALEEAGISTTLRLRRGDSIAGACGQLG